MLDIGCGEGAWRAPLLKLRPKVEYLGFDSSEYAVRRYGRTRNLHLARFGDFAWLRPCAPVDLLVCSDVMHYVPDRELRAGLAGVAELTGGVAFLETFAAEDAFEGDHDGLQARPARWYRRTLAGQGLQPVGSHCWLGPPGGRCGRAGTDVNPDSLFSADLTCGTPGWDMLRGNI